MFQIVIKEGKCMASIKKRDNGTYLITVSCGYDMNN